MKKLFALLLALALTFSLAACGDDKDTGGDNSASAPATTQGDSAPPSDAPADTPADAPADAAANTDQDAPADNEPEGQIEPEEGGNSGISV